MFDYFWYSDFQLLVSLFFKTTILFLNYVFKTASFLFTRKIISKNLHFHMSFFSSSLLHFHWFVLLGFLFPEMWSLQWRGELKWGAEKGHLSHLFALLIRKHFVFKTTVCFWSRGFSQWPIFSHWEYSPFHILVINTDENNGKLKCVTKQLT